MIHDHTPAKRINLISNVRRDPLDEGAAGFKVGAAAGGCCSPFALPFLRVAMCAPFNRPFSSRAVPVRPAVVPLGQSAGGSLALPRRMSALRFLGLSRKEKKKAEQILSVPPTTNGNTTRVARASQGLD